MQYITNKVRPVLVLLAIIWCVEIVNLLLGHSLTTFGILPRDITGLIGIPLAPFIHASLWHALSNTLPFLVLGSLLLTTGHRRYWSLTVSIILLSGIAVWLFARGSYHIGASGLVFGYFGALLTRGVIERSLPSILIAIATSIFYGGLLWGVLPLRSYISFEGHLFGLIAGIISAWIIFRNRPRNADRRKN